MFFTLLLSFCFLFIIYISYRFFIYPKQEINRYLREGFSIGYFYPFLGEFKWMEQMKKKHLDFEHMRIHFMRNHPSSKGIVTHILDSPQLLICDAEMKKDFFTKKSQYYAKIPAIINAFILYPNTSNLIISELDVWTKHRRTRTTL